MNPIVPRCACHRCDRPVAPHGLYDHEETCVCAACQQVCWGDYDCDTHTMDWRTRALVAEGVLAGRPDTAISTAMVQIEVRLGQMAAMDEVPEIIALVRRILAADLVAALRRR